MVLAPVDLRVELEPPRARIQPHRLPQPRALAHRHLEGDLGAQRLGADLREPLRHRPRDELLEMRRVDVPRVPRDRVVLVELEGVPGRRERLAPRCQVDEAAQPPVGSDLRPQVRVLEHDRAVVLAARRDAVVRLRHHPARAALRQLGEHEPPVRPRHHGAPRRPADGDGHVTGRPSTRAATASAPATTPSRSARARS